MTPESIWLLAMAVIIFAFKPGPCFFTSISYCLSHGVMGLVAFVSGFNIGLGVYISIVFIGLMGVNHLDLDLVFFAILAKSFAALYLIVLGVKELRGWDSALNLNEIKIEKPKNFLEIMSSAVLLTLSNPMVIVFYASIIPAFIDPEIITLKLALLIGLMLMVIDSLGMVIYCTPALLFRKIISQVFLKYIKLVSGIVIISIGLYIGYTALPAKDLTSVF